MKKILLGSFLALIISSAAHAGLADRARDWIRNNIPKGQVIARFGQNCTGTCDQPTQVCGANQSLKDWCVKNCGHKFSLDQVCQLPTLSAVKLDETLACPTSIDRNVLRANAGAAARVAYTNGETGGYQGSDFTEVSNLNDARTKTVAWSGVKDCILYIAYRGTANKRDVLKDLQIGVATVFHNFGLGQAFSRGDYNNSVLAAIRFYEESTQKAQGKFKNIIITGHSLGGGLAQNVMDKVGRSQNNIGIITLNAPGTDFLTSKIGGGDKEIIDAEHLRYGRDVVSLWGTQTQGERVTLSGGSSNPIKAHGSSALAQDLANRAAPKG